MLSPLGCTAERFFRIDRAQESLHYLIDITHDQLFVLDDPQRVPSTEEDVTVVLKSKDPPEDLGAQDTTSRSVYFFFRFIVCFFSASNDLNDLIYNLQVSRPLLLKGLLFIGV